MLFIVILKILVLYINNHICEQAPVILYRASKAWFIAMMSKKETVPSSNLLGGSGVIVAY